LVLYVNYFPQNVVCITDSYVSEVYFWAGVNQEPMCPLLWEVIQECTISKASLC
jgi:hypothetical protein